MTLGIMAGVFALGTLTYTAYAIAVAPQIVMFVGLTRATLGRGHVPSRGDRDRAMTRPGRRRFRWLTIGMLAAFVGGLLGLGVPLGMRRSCSFVDGELVWSGGG